MQTSDIRKEFTATLSAYSASLGADFFPISVENANFVPPTKGMWVECFLLPAQTVASTYCKTKQSGIFQINVYANQNTRTDAIDSLAEDIMNLFPWGGKTGNLTHSPPVSRTQGFRVENRYCIAISVHYTSL